MALQLPNSNLGPGHLVLDIGANRGDCAARYLSGGARVVCIEPQAEMVAIIRQRFGSDVTVVHKGVGRDTAPKTININSADPQISSFSTRFIEESRFRGNVWDQSESVMMTTIDDLVKEYGRPSFIKIDVEGYELQVVEGMSEKFAPLSFEFIAEFLDTSLAVIKRLSSIGYNRFVAVHGDLDVPVRQDWRSAEAFSDLLHLWAITNPSAWGDIYADWA